MLNCVARRTLCAGRWPCALLLVGLVMTSEGSAAEPVAVDTARGDALLADYFRRETAALTEATFADIQTLEDWTSRRDEYRRQLFEMLGLDPLPERTPLQAEVIGTLEEEEFVVEKVQFQSRPGLYVTANLYRPKTQEGPLPAVLYVCGHGREAKDGVSFGNKTHYQHHGAWFARNGYVCLTIDTLQLGEIEGIHHGTYKEKMWWWHCHGYTPAGVEAWNCIRALDYLQSRPEVDDEKLGVTGRSGGGAYSWWIAALDERIKAAVPVAGITSLKNHVVDGCIEGHCDCMFQVNTYRWDYPMLAALVAPRPLLISNTDKDRIFPLDGVVDVHAKVRKIYELYGAGDKLGLQITEGPHQDTQELRIHAFVWMNRFLKGVNPMIEKTSPKFFDNAALRVFTDLPADQTNTQIQETFVARPTEFPVADSTAAWDARREEWRQALREKSFRGWPADSADLAQLDLAEVASHEQDGVRLSVYEFTSQEPYRLQLFLAQRANLPRNELELVVLNALDQPGWEEFVKSMRVPFPQAFVDAAPSGEDADGWAETKKMFAQFAWGMAWLAPRGVGPTEWNRDERERTHIRRRFSLLGQTDDGMRIWDVRKGAQALRAVSGLRDVPLWLQGEREAAGWALYASLFEPDIARIDLWNLSPSHREGTNLLNVMRTLDVPQAVALAGERSQVRVYSDDAAAWEYPLETARALGWDAKQIEVRSASRK